MKIWKFTIDQGNAQTIHAPEGAKFLSAQMQHNNMCLWASVDISHIPVPYVVSVIGTGHDFDENKVGDYVGTVQDGEFVWHVFVKPASGVRHGNQKQSRSV